MAQVTYGWNPFQERVDCRVLGEVIKPSGAGTRMEFVPRAAPFYANKFKLYRQGSNQPLVLGVDYVLAHSFDKFIHEFQRNVYGSVVLLKPVEAVLLVDYDTIGGPFVLDQIAFVQLVANIINSPRQADWSSLTDVPKEFPAIPHPHPAAQVFDFLQMLDYLKNLVLAVTTSGGNQVTLRTLLEEHLAKDLIEAHPADKGMLGLDLVENMSKATFEDLQGSSDNSAITVATLKQALRLFQSGDLDLN